MVNNFKLIIPVAGAGKRLRPHTFSMPKPLIPVAGKPMLAHILDPLIDFKPDEVIFVIGYKGGRIKRFVQDNYSFKSSFVNQSDLFGLGYAVYLGLQEAGDSPVLVILGDTIAKTDFDDFTSGGGNRIGLKEVEDPRRFGVATVKDNRITGFKEKPANPKSKMAVIGLYCFEDSVILRKHLKDLIENDKRTRGEIQLTDALEAMLRDGGEFSPYMVDGWHDCGDKETLLETNRKLLKKESKPVGLNGCKIIPPVSISPDAKIEDSVIGPNVTVSRRAVIRNSMLKDSIIFERAEIENCQLENSLIGVDAEVYGIKGCLNIGNSAEVR